MKQINSEFELVEDPQSWFHRHPGVALSLGLVVFSGIQVLSGVWIDDRQRPQWEKIEKAMGKLSQENRQLATFQLESSRYTTLTLSHIAESANVKMPERPKELTRAEDRVRDIQEGAI